MSYVDGFVLVVPKKKRKEYIKIAKDAGKIWKKHGAISYMECVSNDIDPKWSKLLFSKMTKCTSAEEVWFSFITFATKAERNRVNAKVMKEMEEKYPDQKMEDMPFDMKKMAYGGFQAMVEY